MVLNKGLHRWREQKEAQVLHFFPGRTSLFHYFQPLKLSPLPTGKYLPLVHVDRSCAFSSPSENYDRGLQSFESPPFFKPNPWISLSEWLPK